MPEVHAATTSEIIDRRTLVLNFLPKLAGWIDTRTGVTLDPLETEYAEGFGPALAAVLFAKGYEWTRNPDWQRLAVLTLRRSVEVVDSCIPHNTDFTRLFAAYYAFQAYHSIAGSIGTEQRVGFREAFAARQPEYLLNLNGALMTWMHRLNLDTLDCHPCAWNDMSSQIDRLAQRQTPAGFFNDDLDGDGCPGAYHLFCYVIIAQALALRSHSPEKWDLAPFRPVRDRLLEMLARENGWTGRFTAADGSFSMTERSRDHFWTAGAYVAYWRSRGLPDDHPRIQRHLRCWTGLIPPEGAFPLVRNRFHHLYRIGFENYALAVLYTTLGLGLLALAEGDFSPRFVFHPVPPTELDQESDCFVDPAAGYAHWRVGCSSAGVNLARRTASRLGGYALPGGLFNLCLDGRPERLIAAPAAFPAAYSLQKKRGVIAHEGLMAVDSDDAPVWPAPTRCVEASERDGTLRLSWEQADFHAVRTISLDEVGLLSRWDFVLKRALKALELTVPIVVDDGSGVRELRVEPDRALVRLADGREYALFAQGCWCLDLGLSSESTDGLTRSLRMRYAPARLNAGHAASLAWWLRFGSNVESAEPANAAADCQTFALPPISDERRWVWSGSGERSAGVMRRGEWIEYDLPDGQTACVSSRTMKAPWSAPQSGPRVGLPACAGLSALEAQVDYYPRRNRSNVQVVWEVFDGERLVQEAAFSLQSGRNRFPVATLASACDCRIGFRFGGQGRLRVRSLQLRSFPST